ncbi:MAG TPA: malto-oligosyltrehalose synthase [Nitrospirota bacterium]|nr:malto-oligosyltrehalose synthase [Nitrospirota bacterium]
MNRELPTPRIPGSTYRLQFNRRFTFRDAAAVIGYLHDLGVTDIYASPYFRAKAGSLHGYDIVDHNALNPEIGTEEDLAAMTDELKRHGMGQVLDIVPNHMCVADSANSWWMDVLENGPSSPFARFFDIDWSPVKKELKDKVLLPILGDQYGNILEKSELVLCFEEGAFFVNYYEHRFPLRPQTYVFILEHRMEKLREILSADHPEFNEYQSIITALRHLPPHTETDLVKVEERYREKEVIKRRLRDLCSRCPEVGAHIDENIRLFNGTKGDPRSFDLFDGLLRDQAYRLSHWRVATEEINYRRFFDINELGAIHIEYPDVFRATHALAFRLVREGSVTGLRVDHPDGLYNPAEYFHRLQRGCFVQLMTPVQPAEDEGNRERGMEEKYDETVLAEPGYKPFYIVGEKILIRSERMPEDWPIFSTTGYVFLNSVNGIFIDGGNAKAFDRIYEKIVRVKANFQDILYEKKKLIMQVAMASEANTLGHYLNGLSEKNRHTRDFTLYSLRSAVIEVAACFPVYRTYTNAWSVADRDRQIIEFAVSRAKRKNPAISESIFDFLKDVLLLRFPREFEVEDKGAWLDFAMRFQQITGPVTAKGVEDTAFYVYNRLVSLNEVGGAPDRFGTALEAFHGQNIERIKNWPHALIATSTHDTKRGEDVRARINVLSELPGEWAEKVRKWSRMNRKKKTVIDETEAPDRNEEYLLYQTLVGTWPVEILKGKAFDVFALRIKDYMLKASREAKVNTSWINPDAKYEKALLQFIEELLSPASRNRFLEDFLPFQRMVSHFGMLNSLSQTLLKICSPGIPDFYQGTELWDYSLVDPDNRRTVDFMKRVHMLAELLRRESETTGVNLARELSQNKEDGRIKMYLIRKALAFRKVRRELFEQGEYLPLSADGSRAEHVCAFERRRNGDSAIVVVLRFPARLTTGEGVLPFGKGVWEDSRLVLPGAASGRQYRNIFTGEIVASAGENGNGGIQLADVFASFPVALLEQTEPVGP